MQRPSIERKPQRRSSIPARRTRRHCGRSGIGRRSAVRGQRSTARQKRRERQYRYRGIAVRATSPTGSRRGRTSAPGRPEHAGPNRRPQVLVRIANGAREGAKRARARRSQIGAPRRLIHAGRIGRPAAISPSGARCHMRCSLARRPGSTPAASAVGLELRPREQDRINREFEPALIAARSSGNGKRTACDVPAGGHRAERVPAEAAGIVVSHRGRGRQRSRGRVIHRPLERRDAGTAGTPTGHPHLIGRFFEDIDLVPRVVHPLLRRTLLVEQEISPLGSAILKCRPGEVMRHCPFSLDPLVRESTGEARQSASGPSGRPVRPLWGRHLARVLVEARRVGAAFSRSASAALMSASNSARAVDAASTGKVLSGSMPTTTSGVSASANDNLSPFFSPFFRFLSSPGPPRCRAP